MTQTTPARIASDDFAAFVRQLYRLFKTASIHLMNNQAVTQSMERAVAQFNRMGALGLDEVSVLFLSDTVFVNGTLLKASRDVYESALELATLLRRVGVNQITIATSISFDDLLPAVAYASERLRHDAAPRADAAPPVSDAIAMRTVDPSLLDDVQEGAMTAQDRVGRVYASALVVMRFLYDNLKAGRYTVSRQIKRLAQQLVLLAAEDRDAFLSVTRMRTVQDDEAGRAVNTAVLAILTARELTDDVKALSRVALSALLCDVGRPRAAGMGRPGSTTLGVIPRLAPEQRKAMPATTAFALGVIGRLHDEALHRTVVGFEAQRVLQRLASDTGYEAEFVPRLESSLVAAARTFNDLLTFDVLEQRRLSPDEAIRAMRRAATTEEDRLCAELLFQALGLIVVGTVVQLASGHRGVVMRNSDRPGLYGLPAIQVFAAPDRTTCETTLVDLAHPDANVVRFGGVVGLLPGETAPGDLPRVEIPDVPPPRPAAQPRPAARLFAPRSDEPMASTEALEDLDDDVVVEFDSRFPASEAAGVGDDDELLEELDDEELDTADAAPAALRPPPLPSLSVSGAHATTGPPRLPSMSVSGAHVAARQHGQPSVTGAERAAGPPPLPEPTPARAGLAGHALEGDTPVPRAVRTLSLTPDDSAAVLAAAESATSPLADPIDTSTVTTARLGDDAPARGRTLSLTPQQTASILADPAPQDEPAADAGPHTPAPPNADAARSRRTSADDSPWLTPIDVAALVEEAVVDVERRASSAEMAVMASPLADDSPGVTPSPQAGADVGAANAELDALLATYFGETSAPVSSGAGASARTVEHRLSESYVPPPDPAMTGPLPSVEDISSMGSSVSESVLYDHFPDAAPLRPKLAPTLDVPAAPAAALHRLAEDRTARAALGDDVMRSLAAFVGGTAEPASGRLGDGTRAARVSSTASGPVAAHDGADAARGGDVATRATISTSADGPAIPRGQSSDRLSQLLSAYLLDEVALTPTLPPRSETGQRSRVVGGAASTEDLLAAYLREPTARPAGGARPAATPRRSGTTGQQSAARAAQPSGARHAVPTRTERPRSPVERVSGYVADDAARVAAARPRVARPSQAAAQPRAFETAAEHPSEAAVATQPLLFDAPNGGATERLAGTEHAAPGPFGAAGSVGSPDSLPGLAIDQPAWARFDDEADPQLADTPWETGADDNPSDDAEQAPPRAGREPLALPGTGPGKPGRPVSLELELQPNMVALEPGNPFERQAPPRDVGVRSRVALAATPIGTPAVDELSAVGWHEEPVRGGSAPATSEPEGQVDAHELAFGATLFGVRADQLAEPPRPAPVVATAEMPAERAAVLLGGVYQNDPFADLMLDDEPARDSAARTRGHGAWQGDGPRGDGTDRVAANPAAMNPSSEPSRGGQAPALGGEPQRTLAMRFGSASGPFSQAPSAAAPPVATSDSMSRRFAPAPSVDKPLVPTHDTVEIPPSVSGAVGAAARAALSARRAAPTPSSALPVVDAPGTDTVEVTDGHAADVLRDYIVGRSEAPPGRAGTLAEPAATPADTGRPPVSQPAPRAGKALARPADGDATREVTGASAADLLKRYLADVGEDS